jgi:hypothetical protein
MIRASKLVLVVLLMLLTSSEATARNLCVDQRPLPREARLWIPMSSQVSIPLPRAACVQAHSGTVRDVRLQRRWSNPAQR